MGSKNGTIMCGDINQFTFEKAVLIHNLIYVLDGTFQVKRSCWNVMIMKCLAS